MKIRIGFVSNSSSSSFVILKKDLSEEQIVQIRNHIEYSATNFPKILYAYENQFWNVDEKIKLYTFMDNFNMHEFLLAIGVKDDNIECGSY